MPVTHACLPGRGAAGQACAARRTGPRARALARSRLRAAGRCAPAPPRAPDRAAARQPTGSALRERPNTVSAAPIAATPGKASSASPQSSRVWPVRGSKLVQLSAVCPGTR